MLILPKELARNLSNISRLVLAKRIGSGIHIVDPLTGEVRLLDRCLCFLKEWWLQKGFILHYQSPFAPTKSFLSYSLHS